MIFARPGSGPEGDLRRQRPCRTFQRRGWPESDCRIIIGPIRVQGELFSVRLQLFLASTEFFSAAESGHAT